MKHFKNLSKFHAIYNRTMAHLLPALSFVDYSKLAIYSLLWLLLVKLFAPKYLTVLTACNCFMFGMYILLSGVGIIAYIRMFKCGFGRNILTWPTMPCAVVSAVFATLAGGGNYAFALCLGAGILLCDIAAFLWFSACKFRISKLSDMAEIQITKAQAAAVNALRGANTTDEKYCG